MCCGPSTTRTDSGVSPDAQDEGEWLLVPDTHGQYADENRISKYVYDHAGRRIEQRDPLGNVSETVYFKDGQVKERVDPEAMSTQYRYDGVRRRKRVVQGYAAQATDPEAWAWDAADARWEDN